MEAAHDGELLITIATNVYNSANAPVQRGFSYVEIWMIGIQIPILTALSEYGILLTLKKYQKEFDINNASKILDKWTLVGSLFFILIFNIVYWFMGLNQT